MIILAADTWALVLVALTALLGLGALGVAGRDLWRAGRTPGAYASDDQRPERAGNQD